MTLLQNMIGAGWRDTSWVISSQPIVRVFQVKHSAFDMWDVFGSLGMRAVRPQWPAVLADGVAAVNMPCGLCSLTLT